MEVEPDKRKLRIFINIGWKEVAGPDFSIIIFEKNYLPVIYSGKEFLINYSLQTSSIQFNRANAKYFSAV